MGNLATLYPDLKDLQVEFFHDNLTNNYGQIEPALNKDGDPIRRIVVNARPGIVSRYRESGYFKGHRPSANEGRVSEGVGDGTAGRGATGILGSGRQGHTVLSDTFKHLTQILSHEIQHFIAGKEGWDKGSHPKTEIKSVTNRRAAEIQKLYTQAIATGNMRRAAETRRAYDRLKYTTAQDLIDGRYTDPHLQDIYREAYNKYLDNPGEVQARNAAIRAQLTPEERKALPISESADTKFLSRPDGAIYGFVQDGQMYLNGDKLNANTPIHEAGHLFTQWAKDNAPELYRAGLDKMAGTRYLKEAKADPFYKKRHSS